MKIGIMTNEMFDNRQKGSVGSSRIRGTWLAKNWEEAEIFKIGKPYDAIIYQKAYFIKHAKVFKGVKILDLCDPDWLDGKPVIEMIEYCDAVTTSSEKLAEYIKKLTDKPVVYIPDRMDLEFYNEKKDHKGDAHEVVWFGYNCNHKTIDQVLITLKRLGLSLTVISDMPYYPSARSEGITDEWIKRNLKNIKYDNDFINEEIINGGDIVINPRIETGRFKYKSKNKTISAWALGMPVAETSEDLDKFMKEEERKKESAIRLEEINQNWFIDLSVKQYKNLINSIHEGK